MIRNFLTATRQEQMNSHDGKGPVGLYEVWGRDDFQSNCDFIDRVTIPPGSEVGYHRHGENEEMYIILSGEGTMTIEGEPRRITAGDMILNPVGGAHGLVNDSEVEIDILVIQMSVGGKSNNCAS
jgi:mannose-6-phosphate isomerase-like protein (cupin superfamily)